MVVATPTPSCSISVRARAGALHRGAAALISLLASIDSASDVVMCIEAGIHTLDGRPLQLGPEHNHPRGGRVIWRGDPSQATVISAGAPLRKWVRCFDGTHCNKADWQGVWAHAVKDVPNASSASAPFRQLWVDGRRVARATEIASVFALTPTAFGYVSNNTPMISRSWVDDKVELRWPRQIRNWIEPRCVLSEVAAANLTVAEPCWTTLIARNDGKLPPPPLLLENRVRPPPAGDFVSSREYLYYRPPADAPFAAPSDAWVPLLGAVVNASGLVSHTFCNLTFTHATWQQASSPDGYVPTQSAVTPLGEPLGAARFMNVTNVSIQGCTFANLGAAYALSVGGASHSVAIRASRFDSLAGGAIKLGNVLGGRELSTERSQMDTDFEVMDNVVRAAALEYRGAAALFAGYVAATKIAHNTIRDIGYTAISVGWGWGTHVVGNQTFARDNHIVANYMSGVMSALNDGGCTYTLGPQPGSTVTDNYCEADRAPVVGSFYHDNGSRYFTTVGNVASSSAAPCLFLQGCCGAPALDITVNDLWCRDEGAVLNRCAKGVVNCTALYAGTDADCHCDIDDSTVHTLPAGAAWPAEAQAIIAAAGARV